MIIISGGGEAMVRVGARVGRPALQALWDPRQRPDYRWLLLLLLLLILFVGVMSSSNSISSIRMQGSDGDAKGQIAVLQALERGGKGPHHGHNAAAAAVRHRHTVQRKSLVRSFVMPYDDE